MIHIGLVYWHVCNSNGEVIKIKFFKDFIEDEYSLVKLHHFRERNSVDFHEGAYWMILK